MHGGHEKTTHTPLMSMCSRRKKAAKMADNRKNLIMRQESEIKDQHVFTFASGIVNSSGSPSIDR